MRYSLSSGVAVRLVAGGLWLLALGERIDAAWSLGGALVWTVPAAVTWYVLAQRVDASPPRKPHGFLWWLLSFTGPLTLVLLAIPPRTTAAPAPVMEEPMGTDDLHLRLGAAEDRMRLLQAELDAIRAELRARGPAAEAPSERVVAPEPVRPTVREPFPAPARVREPFPPHPGRPVTPAPVTPAPVTPAPVTPAPAAAAAPRPPRELDLGALLGPKALAWAGGLVTLLGVLFFFILAVGRGWIGPGERVAFGAAASALVFGGGLWLRRRFGETYSSLAAVGAGIAGGYATLAAAAALYDLLSKPVALVVAACIAAAALAVALAWRAELVAALGLIGAIAAPALLATEGGLTAAGVGFAAIVSAAALAVAVRLRWRWLLVGAIVASLPQVAALVLVAHRHDGGAIAMAIVFALLYLAAGVAEQLATGEEALAPLPTLAVLGSLALTWLTAARLFGPAAGGSAGVALLVAAAVFGAAGAALWLRAQRELATLLGTIALAAVGVGAANLLSGANLAYTFAAEGVVLAFAARRLREPRLQLGALVYVALAGAHALIIDAPPDSLVHAARHPATGTGALAATIVGALAVIRTSDAEWRENDERGVLRFLAPVVAGLRRHERELRMCAAAVATAFAVDAVSLLVLELFEDAWTAGGVTAAFHRGHVAVTGLWSLGGLAAVVLATRRRSPTARFVGFGWLAITAVKVASHDGSQLTGLGFSLAFLLFAAALLLAGYLAEILGDRKALSWEAAVAVLGAVVYSVVSLFQIDSELRFGLGLLAVASVLVLFAAGVFERRRDLCTLLWGPALCLAAVAVPLMLDATWVTFAWALAAAALATLTVVTRERRFLVGSLGYTVLTAGSAFVHAPPTQLVVARAHPAHGIVGILLLVGAVACVAWAVGATPARARVIGLWTAAVLLVHSASLAILELSMRVSSASMHTDFQRGHSAVSALWGALGLALLYVGLTRRRRALRLGGFALFGVSLGKLFLYDLSQLSSITRALSFLAVGAVLLLGGFFMQRLSAQDGPRAYI